jgi:hypothetical protein
MARHHDPCPLPNIATVQRSHDTDAREHRRSVKFRDQQQRFHRGLPFVGIVFRFRQFGDVLGGIAQRAQRLLSARQYDRIKNSRSQNT